jgi:hypothetical protein
VTRPATGAIDNAPTSATAETLAAWSKVTDEAVDANPVTGRIRDLEPVTFLRTNPSAVAPPDDYDEEFLLGNCFNVIQGGRAYKVCRSPRGSQPLALREQHRSRDGARS